MVEVNFALDNYLIIDSDTLGVAWIKSIYVVLRHGKWIKDDSEKLIEFRNLYLKIKNIDELDPIIKRYADQNRIDLMKLKYKSCDIISNYKVSYGKLLYDNQGVNQIEWVINRLKYKPETKSATICLHIPGRQNLSCLSILDFKLRENLLYMNAVYRSQNIFASQFGNLIALNEIQKYVANHISYKIGYLNLIILSAHIYEHDIDKAEKVIRNFPKLEPLFE